MTNCDCYYNNGDVSGDYNESDVALITISNLITPYTES